MNCRHIFPASKEPHPSGILRGLLSRAQARVEQAQKAIEQVRKAREKQEQRPRGPGRPIHWAAREQAATEALTEAEAEVRRVESYRERLRAGVRALGHAYHPVSLATGAWQTAQQVKERLEEGFEGLWVLTAEVNEGTTSDKLARSMSKAMRVVDALVVSVRGWQQGVEARLLTLKLSETERAFVRTEMLPLVYLNRVAQRGANHQEKQELRAVREQVRERVLAAESPWHSWSREVKRSVLSMAETSVGLFVRASSMVEGRHGQLSLYHHRLHHLTPGLLKALTAVHNYVVRRPDGTTAAERFFGEKHEDLFEHLVSRMGEPSRPRKRKKKKEPLLEVA